MMSLKSRRELLAAVAPRYRKASATERSHILDEFVATTGYHRKYALRLLNHPLSKASPPKKRQRPRLYSFPVQQALIRCWRATNGICSKRLVPYLPELVSVLERVGELHLEAPVKAQLLALSPATADRLLQEERHRTQLRGLSTTKPGTLFTDVVPIRTFAEWNDVQPGFLEIDLVAHVGGSVKGDYLSTLTATDISTGWTECLAVRNHGKLAVFQAIIRMRAHLPFPLLGLDSDNGVEFLNTHLVTYCEQEQLIFTRARPHKKNDQAYVEQKNWSIVRHLVGYARLEGQASWDALQNLYDVVRVYVNFFQPSMKLVSKEREGAKVKKTYDTAQTPYHRVLADEHVSAEAKAQLTCEYLTLNPVALLRKMKRLQETLWNLAVSDAAMPVIEQITP